MPASTAGSGGGADSGGSAGATQTDAAATGPLAYQPCDQKDRAGGFALELKPEMEGMPPFAQLIGQVGDRADASDVWRTVLQEGACAVLDLPVSSCNPPCGLKACAPANQCVPRPQFQDLGPLTLTGLPAPVTPLGPGKQYYMTFPAGRYPPFPVEAEVKLTTAGGAYAPLALAGRGIVPLQFNAPTDQIANNKPLPLSWTAPAQPGSARIHIGVDIAHHGGIGSRLECEVPDTGSYTIPAALITKLISLGTAGYPTVTLTRRTMDSTTIAPGCVDFAVASSIEQPVNVEGVISCNDTQPCPGGRRCGPDLKCP